MGETRRVPLVIAGGGPAGLTAAIYAVRAGIECLLIERGVPGGQMFMADRIENYPGFPDGISGQELSDRMREQVVKLGASIIQDEIQALELEGDLKRVRLASGDTVVGEALIAAPGSRPNYLKVPGEMELMGRGVSYCATCDGNFFRGQPLAVVGGGDSALQEATMLTNLASQVTLIHRRDQFRGQPYLVQCAREQKNLEVILDSVVERIEGETEVTGLRLRNVKTQAVSVLPVAGVFIYVGVTPLTGFLQGIVDLTAEGYIVAGEDGRTSVAGIFAAGDARTKTARQIATAVGDGATAVRSLEIYLIEKGLSCRYV